MSAGLRAGRCLPTGRTSFMRSKLPRALVVVTGLIGILMAAALSADPPARPDAADGLDAMKSVLDKHTFMQDRGPRQIPYIVLFLEFFDNADCEKACAGFQNPVFVFDRLDEFATVLIKVQENADDTKAAYSRVLNSSGLRWLDDGGI